MRKTTEILEDLKNKIELTATVNDGVVSIRSNKEEIYLEAVKDELGLESKQIDDLNKFNGIWGKAAVYNLGQTLGDAYKSNKDATSFEAEIPFFNNPIKAKGKRETSGKIPGTGKTWHGTGFEIKHDGYNIPVTKVKEALYATIND